MTGGVTIDIKYYPGAPEADNNAGTYFYNDESKNKIITLTLNENPAGLPGYKSVTHTPNSGDTIKEIKYETPQNGLPNNIPGYPSVSVYYWKVDGNGYQPLALQLGKGDEYYIYKSRDTWESTTASFSGLSLLEILNIRSCSYTQAHVINLSATSEPYKCPSCGSTDITVSGPNTKSGYSWYEHTISGGNSSISGMEYKNKYQTGIKFPQRITRVCVYHYPNGANGIPFLIYLPYSSSGNIWYQRISQTSNKWDLMKDPPTGGNSNNSRILPLIQKIFSTAQNPTTSNNAPGADGVTPILPKETTTASPISTGPTAASSVTKSPGTILIVGFLSPGLPRGSLNILYSESKAVSDQPASTQDLEVLEDSATVNSSEDIFPEQILENFPKSAQEHLENLLNFKVNLESMVPGKRRKTAVEPQKTEARSTKPARRTPFKLEYDTKTEPFRHVEEGECKIPNFANVWNAIVDMRQKKDAPVDTMGAHCLADSPDPATYEFQTLVACMLSSQTKDQVTAQTMDVLKKRGLTLDSIMEISEEELDTLISRVGFHNTKAKNIKKTAAIIHEKFGGRVPDTMEELVSLPGVGPKMANLVIQLAFKRIDGISVDLHVHRISNRLGWVKTKTPDETRLQLQELIPQKLWAEVNHLLVGFGQTICTAAGPGCATCGANKWCPTGIANLKRGV